MRYDLREGLVNPIPAWWAHAEPLAFDLGFRPVAGIRRFHTGTMPIISLAAIEAGLEDVAEAGIERLREKSVSLGEFLIAQWEQHLADLGFAMASPRRPQHRGSHISLSHRDAWPITRAMIDIGKVLPDFRAPDTLRLGLAPLYTTHLEVHTAVNRISSIVETGMHEGFGDTSLTVT